MIRHIVAFRLVAEDAAGRADAARELKSVLEALPERIPDVSSLEVGPDLGKVDGHWDAVLVSEHPDVAALERYQAHPEHQAALQRINSLVAARAVVDYTVTAIAV